MSAFDTYRQMRDSTLRNGENAREEAYQGQQRNALSVAGNLYGNGDQAGAVNTLARAGNLSLASSLEQNYRTGQRQEQTDLRATEDRQRGFVASAVKGLLALPEDQWNDAFTTRIAPQMQEYGLGDHVGPIVRDGITRAEMVSLATEFGLEIPSAYANDRAGPNNSIIRPGADGKYTSVFEAPFDRLAGADRGYAWTDPTRTRQSFIPGGAADPSQVGAIADERRAPPRARSGGSGGGRSSSPRTPYSSSAISWD